MTVRASAAAAAARFAEVHGRAPEGIWSAPGRVNIIGEHTDYNDGYVLPFALPQRTYAAVGRRDDGTVRLTSGRQADAVTVALTDLAPGRPAGWAGYVAGVAWALRDSGYDVGGFDVHVESDVPTGAGLSSSAALECATALALNDVFGLSLSAGELARLAQRAENAFVGVPCGLMDQMAAMTCTAGHSLFFDVRSSQTQQIPFAPDDSGLAVVVVDTRAHHALADGEYARRRTACEDAAAELGVPALRDVRSVDDAWGRLSDDVTRRRMRHVVTEDARVLAAVDVLCGGRVADLGPLLTASHASLRDDFEVSCDELDVAVEAALEAGALGARMTGGGFGGCAIALVPAQSVDAAADAVAEAFANRGFAAPRAWSTSPADGAHRDS